MKLILVLMVTTILQANAVGGYAQNITLSERNISLTKVFRAISNQSKYEFVYDAEMLREARPVSVKFRNTPVESVLRQCFENQPLTYTIIDNIVLVKRVRQANSAEQQVRITGLVTDGKNTPLPGVSIKLKGTSTGTATDVDGRYAINLPDAAGTLVFSYIGFATREIAVSNKTVIDVVLSEDVAKLNEIVVVGYQSVKKSDLTGAVGMVKVEDIVKAPVSTFAEALAGRIAGVQVNSADGQPGSGMNINIRGASSINNSTQPLYVIDGFATEDDEAVNLNPDDIESISVLKDASSTAIYGSRATNGVIVIQTKRGKPGKPVITFNSSYGIQNMHTKRDLMNPYEFVKYQFERNQSLASAAYLTNGKTLDSYRNMQGIDWTDEITRTGGILKNNLAVRGGNEQTKYSISGSGFDQKGVLLNTGYNRYQGRVTIDQKISEKFDAGVTTEYVDVSAFGGRATANPVGAAGSALWFRTWGYRPIGGSSTSYDLLEEPGDAEIIYASDIRLNPRITSENEHRLENNINFTANAYLTYKFTKDLILKVTGVKNTLKLDAENFYNSLTPQGSPLNPLRANGIYGNVGTTNTSIWSNENTLTYNKRFSDVHSLNIIAGNSFWARKARSFGYTSTFLPEESQGIPGLNEGTAIAPVSTATGNRIASFFGILDYNYKSKYYVKGSLRADGSSRFAERWGYFPTAAVAWTMSNEEFMKNLPVISNSKIRLSYGRTGNERIGDFDWYAKLNLDVASTYPFNGSPNTGAYISSVENRNLTWEKTEKMDIGYELGLFGNRIELTVDAYKHKSKDLLLSGAKLPSHTGFSSATLNIASLQNTGLELGLNTVNIRNTSFSWESNFNITFNRNKLLGLNRDDLLRTDRAAFDSGFSEDLYVSKIGEPLGMMLGYIWEGNYQYSDFDNPSPGVYVLKSGVSGNGSNRTAIQPGDIKYKDINGDGIVNTYDKTVIGRGQPIHYGGFNNNFRYKGFDMNVFLQWSYGNDLYNANRLTFEGNANNRPDLNQFASYIDRWSPDNQDSPNFRAGGQGVVGYWSSRVVEDGSYLRLKTVSLGYNIPQRYIRKVYLSSLRLNVSAQNLWTWTKYTGLDPEVSTRSGTSGALTPGFDYSSYPQAQTVVFGLNATF